MDSRVGVKLGPANRGERPRKKEATKRVGGPDSRREESLTKLVSTSRCRLQVLERRSVAIWRAREVQKEETTVCCRLEIRNERDRERQERRRNESVIQVALAAK